MTHRRNIGGEKSLNFPVKRLHLFVLNLFYLSEMIMSVDRKANS